MPEPRKIEDEIPVIERMLEDLKSAIDNLKCIPKHTWKSIAVAIFLAMITAVLGVVAVKVAQHFGITDLIAEWVIAKVRHVVTVAG